MRNWRLKTLAALVLCAALSATLTGIAQAEPLLLLDHGTSGVINEAVFVQVDPASSTGTGTIQPFLRVQSKGVEQGYNTDYAPKEFSDSTSPWTRSLQLSEVPVVNVRGACFREFLLDINESGGGDQYLSLDTLQIFLGDSPDLTGYPSGLGTKIWDMDAGTEGNTSIHLDYELEAGSGDGDMLAYIPNSLFADMGPYVYLYCQFGAEGTRQNGLGSSAGFEEWAVRVPGADSNVVPEPGGLLMLCTGIVSLVGMCMRKAGRRYS